MIFTMFHFFKRKLRRYYISPLDRTLDTFRRQTEKTLSQQYEIQKHARIARLRDKKPLYHTSDVT